MQTRNKLRLIRKKRSSCKTQGTAQRPRLAVFKSLCNLYIQVVDDTKNQVIFGTDSRKVKEKKFDVKSAQKLGELLAAELAKKKIKRVVFDRSGYRYHGKIKALAESARKNGLQF